MINSGGNLGFTHVNLVLSKHGIAWKKRSFDIIIIIML
jgi:hypothetical protein